MSKRYPITRANTLFFSAERLLVHDLLIFLSVYVYIIRLKLLKYNIRNRNIKFLSKKKLDVKKFLEMWTIKL